MKSIALAFGLLLVLALASPAAAQDQGAMSSQQLIQFIAKNKGKVVLVNFWASWCAPCRKEVPELVRLRKEYGDDKLVIVGVSVDQDQAAYQEFARKAGINYPTFQGKADVMQAFNVRLIPKIQIYSKEGEKIVDNDGALSTDELDRIIKKLAKG